MASSLITTNHRIAAAFLLPSPHSHLRLSISKPNSLPFSPLPKPFKSRISTSVSAAPINPVIESPNNPEILSGSTRTVTTLVALGLTASRLLAQGVLKFAVQLKEPLLCVAGPAFFAAVRDVPTGSLNTPFMVVAAGMAKWLDLYCGVLMLSHSVALLRASNFSQEFLN
ncbi:hypothetical protein C2S53_019860 [Perilla frutescens var. hirtella]|uniref:Uncharacterized protein n=1 Tax=Perilla frutescens var. hirtella TaxID=608512 RepID=A0AAD4IT50_PERFH|nr:hypothetical protein C2S53_019860 [Perilla frutescens var. hirtella]